MFLSVITFSFSASLLSVCCTHFRTLSLYTRLGEREVDEPSAVCNYLLGHRLLVSPVSPVAASHLSRLTITSSVRQLLNELVDGQESITRRVAPRRACCGRTAPRQAPSPD